MSPELDLIYSKERYLNLFLRMAKLNCLYVDNCAVERNKAHTIPEDQITVLIDKGITDYPISTELMIEVLKDIYEALRMPIITGKLTELKESEYNGDSELHQN